MALLKLADRVQVRRRCLYFSSQIVQVEPVVGYLHGVLHEHHTLEMQLAVGLSELPKLVGGNDQLRVVRFEVFFAVFVAVKTDYAHACLRVDNTALLQHCLIEQVVGLLLGTALYDHVDVEVQRCYGARYVRRTAQQVFSRY